MNIDFNIWRWFNLNNLDELYTYVSAMIESKIKEMLPAMIDQKLREQLDTLSFNFHTSLNGKSSDDLKKTIVDMIVREL